MVTSTITVNPPIVDNHDLVKTYRNASQYTVRIIGSTGNPVGAGVSVSFNNQLTGRSIFNYS